VKIFDPTGTRTPAPPGHSARSLSLYRLNYRLHTGRDQILAELIQAGAEILQFEIHKLINSIWTKEELRKQWKESIIAPIYKKNDKTDQ
jgi:hypothetical protein